MEIKRDVKLWASNDEVLAKVLNGTVEKWELNVEAIDMSDHWTLVGVGSYTSTFTMLSEDEMRGKAAEALREKIKEEQARSYQKVKELNERLQNLLALSYDPSGN